MSIKERIESAKQKERAMSDVRKEFEETALVGCKAVRAFLTYQGNNKDYFNKARAGAVAMSSYARLRATMANEEALRLTSVRLDGPPERKKLSA